jgi:hypothetical protein
MTEPGGPEYFCKTGIIKKLYVRRVEVNDEQVPGMPV